MNWGLHRKCREQQLIMAQYSTPLVTLRCLLVEDWEGSNSPLPWGASSGTNANSDPTADGPHSSAELPAGKADLTSINSPYALCNMTYKEEDFDRLLQLSEHNVQSSQSSLLQALRMALGRRARAPPAQAWGCSRATLSVSLAGQSSSQVLPSLSQPWSQSPESPSFHLESTGTLSWYSGAEINSSVDQCGAVWIIAGFRK